MNQIQRRVERIETKLKVSTEPETLEKQLEKFDSGQFGYKSTMSLVVAANNSGIDSVVKSFPEPLKSYFREVLTKAMNKHYPELEQN